jgi:hypothetical protein
MGPAADVRQPKMGFRCWRGVPAEMPLKTYPRSLQRTYVVRALLIEGVVLSDV